MKINCVICNKECNIKPFRIKRLRLGKFSCSMDCLRVYKSQTMKGEGNHQFGLIGDKNSSFKGSETISNYGYVLEYCNGHPRPHDKSSKGVRVKQHRLVIERNYKLFDEKYFDNIDGWIVLKEKYDVHHINEIRTDNSLDNLQILTRSEHTILHNKKKVLNKCKKNGRIISIKKQ